MIVTVDTGATKILITEFSRDGKIGETTKLPTPHDQQTYITVLREFLQKNYSSQDIERVVIALPGIIKDGIAVWCNNLGWKDLNMKAALDGVFSNSPLILVENDANLAGLAEARALHPIPRSAFYVTISTGIGTGIITNGQIDPGLRYSEGGHTLVEFQGKIQEWEQFASGNAIHVVYGQFARDINSKDTWKEIADRISRGFLAVIPIIQPDIVIIGGSIGTYFKQYAKEVENILQAQLPAHIPCPQFIQAKHPEQAVVYGCYYYAIDSLSHN